MHECNYYKDLLIRHATEGISAQLFERLQKHLEDCKDCRKVQQNIVRLQQVMHVDSSNFSGPSPDIAQKLRREIRKNRHDHIFTTLRLILSYKIPVYQAAIGAVFVALFFWLSTHSTVIPLKVDKISDDVTIQSNTVGYYTTQQALDLLQYQNVGIEVSKDSLLMQFTRTTL
ncbi:hypothetical protein JW935_23050 [candidate division KSB1 bacterium]|nr:hypothetical protein [candidate division KSB1 bacterium]